MAYLRKLCGILAVSALLPATAALADAPPAAAAAAPAAAPAPAAGEAAATRPLFKAGPWGFLGSASNSPNVLAAWVPADHVLVGLGMSLTINGNGLSGPDSTNVACNLIVGGEYMVFDKYPFAMGPEVLLIGSLAPGNALDTFIIQPGWAAWYAPFHAPFLVGTSLEVPITILKSQQPVLSIATAGLRLGYIFGL